MADSKRYYWIKLKTDFFNQETIDFLMSQENGCQYIVLYQMLCLQTANNNGELATKIGEIIVPFDTKKIVRDTKYFDYDTVTVAMELFAKLGLIYREENQILRISNFEEMVGSETEAAKRKRIQRQSVGQIEDKSGTMSQTMSQTMSHKSIENRYKSIDNRDIEKEREKEREESVQSTHPSENKPRHKYGEYNNVLLTDTELEKLKNEFPDWQNRIESLSAYIASTGKRYKSHLATIRNWARMEKERYTTTATTAAPLNKMAQKLDDEYKMIAEWGAERMEREQ